MTFLVKVMSWRCVNFGVNTLLWACRLLCLICDTSNQVMIGLCGSPDKFVRAKAIRSLGRLTWNGGVEPSVVSYFARDLWARWLERLSEKASAAMQVSPMTPLAENDRTLWPQEI